MRPARIAGRIAEARYLLPGTVTRCRRSVSLAARRLEPAMQHDVVFDAILKELEGSDAIRPRRLQCTGK
jgi:hypothetical protein